MFPSYADLLKVTDGFWELLIAFIVCLNGLLTDDLVTTLIKAATIEPPSTALSFFIFSDKVQPMSSPSNAPHNLQRNHSQLGRNFFQQYGESFME